MNTFQIGQRWMSEMEPELGLGIVTEIKSRTILIHFPASECDREYAISSAPLKRVEFSKGDVVQNRTGKSITIDHVDEHDGLKIYIGDKDSIAEIDLNDSLGFTSPRDRLLSGFTDSNKSFNFRYKTRKLHYNYLQSQAIGFMGGRIDIILHQFYVAQQVVSRPNRRVLLSDQIGLGKTIEACLIIHRLLISGRINRVLILVPESLVHQWFVELLRRFNLFFRISNQEYCESVSAPESDENAFLQDQLVLGSIDFLVQDQKWQHQAFEAGWDMVVIDEAHHLRESSPEYNFVKLLGFKTKDMLLLTATPEQFGQYSHFSRLQILDPARFSNYKDFLAEQENYQSITALIQKLESQTLTGSERDRLVQLLPEYTDSISPTSIPDESIRFSIIERLIDHYGTSRVMYRNTRSTIKGFPDRKVHLIALEGNQTIQNNTKAEFLESQDFQPSTLMDDPRIYWLVSLLKQNKQAKFVLICRSIVKVRAIEAALLHHMKIKAALFHEKLSLIQRDRNAAWFSEPDGAQLLICSEIGSEGRNFQFAQRLVLFDLPMDPELLEQRIGRLDRIGQKDTIHIYIPYVCDTPYHVLVRWYHEGMNAFAQNVPAAYALYQTLGEDVQKAVSGEYNIHSLIQKTRSKRIEFTEKLHAGRDKLLELYSFRPEKIRDLIQDISNFDQSQDLEYFMLNVFDHFNIRYDEIMKLTYRLDFEFLSKPEFPLPPIDSMKLTVTFSRRIALNREEITFLSWDHPMVIGAIDLLLSSESGTTAIAHWPSDEQPQFLLETVFIIESIAPGRLHVDRFLPPSPVRLLVSHNLEDKSNLFPHFSFCKYLRPFKTTNQLNQIREQLVPKMLMQSQQLAEKCMKTQIDQSLTKMKAVYNHEIERLAKLVVKNQQIESDIGYWRQERDHLKQVISEARLRLDAIRLIYKGPEQY